MRDSRLYLHCGANIAPREDLALTPLPPVTETYHPLAHDVFVDLVEDKMADIGFRFGEQAHSLTRGGQRYFGLVNLLNGEAGNEQHALVMGLRNSYDKAFAASLTWGSVVFVCDNLAFSGEVVIGRKHTSRIMEDLPGLITAGVSHTKFMAKVQTQRFEFYQQAGMTDRQADLAACELYRRKVISSSRIGAVIDEWDEPSHDHGGYKVWRFFNAVTEVLKSASLLDRPKQTIELQAVCDTVAGFVPELSQLEVVH